MSTLSQAILPSLVLPLTLAATKIQADGFRVPDVGSLVLDSSTLPNFLEVDFQIGSRAEISCTGCDAGASGDAVLTSGPPTGPIELYNRNGQATEEAFFASMMCNAPTVCISSDVEITPDYVSQTTVFKLSGLIYQQVRVVVSNDQLFHITASSEDTETALMIGDAVWETVAPQLLQGN